MKKILLIFMFVLKNSLFSATAISSATRRDIQNAQTNLTECNTLMIKNLKAILDLELMIKNLVAQYEVNEIKLSIEKETKFKKDLENMNQKLKELQENYDKLVIKKEIFKKFLIENGINETNTIE